MVLQESKSAMTATSTINATINSIAQAHLDIWETCQRRYQYNFLEGLSLPDADLQRKQNLVLGANFHLLMQQQQLGLDVSDLANSDPALQTWLAAFKQQPPIMIAGDRLCEHRRTLEVAMEMPLHHKQNLHRDQGYFVLTAIYDFLILGDRKAQILDWKTHQVAIAANTLKNKWQTRLYLYLLAKTTNYAPEQISMTYWFANTAESVIINYSEAEYRRTETELQQILTEINQAIAYPLTNERSKCKYCEFRDRCDRVDGATNTLSPDIGDIPEVVI